MQVECDGKLLELPEDIEGLLLLNINSYMGGVNLWASGAWQPGRHTTAKQSICDGKLEVGITSSTACTFPLEVIPQCYLLSCHCYFTPLE